MALHFSRVYPFPAVPEHRTIDILLNDQVVLDGYVLGSTGFNVADVRRFEVEVVDGVLEIAFKLSWRADVAAIEVRRTGT